MFKGFVYALPDKATFIAALQKPCPFWMEEQIREDFAPFKLGIPLSSFESTGLRYFGHEAPFDPEIFFLVKFKIRNNQLFMDSTNNASGRASYVLKALKYLIETIGLPDLDVVMTMADAVNDHYSFLNQKGPVFAFAKKKDTKNVILIPDFEALSDYKERFDDKSLQRYVWENKEKKAFWRGATTGNIYKKNNLFSIPRVKLTLLSLKYPNLVDAKFTAILPMCENEAEIKKILSDHDLLANYANIDDQLKYQYLIDIDGNSCSYSRCYWILLSNSMLLKQESDDIQWYYKGLIPYQNYVPYKNDFSDIIDKVEWAIKHDCNAKRIAINATEFARKDLSVEYIYLYFYKVLLEYARLQEH